MIKRSSAFLSFFFPWNWAIKRQLFPPVRVMIRRPLAMSQLSPGVFLHLLCPFSGAWGGCVVDVNCTATAIWTWPHTFRHVDCPTCPLLRLSFFPISYINVLYISKPRARDRTESEKPKNPRDRDDLVPTSEKYIRKWRQIKAKGKGKEACIHPSPLPGTRSISYSPTNHSPPYCWVSL